MSSENKNEIELKNRHENVQTEKYEDETLEIEAPKNEDREKEPPLDEGYAWVILVASFFNFFFSFGNIFSFGVFQTYYLKTMFVNEPANKIAWISTMSNALTTAGGIFAAPIIRKIGLRNAGLLGSIIGTIGLIGASFSTKIWQLIITQGIIYGFGAAIVVNVSLVVPSLWFNKYRSFALSLISSGGGIGSLILVPTVTACVGNLTIGWAFRILAAAYFVSTFVGSLLVKPRTTFKPGGKLLDFSLIKDPVTIMICINGFFLSAGYNIPTLYFPASLVDLGKTRSYATNLIMLFTGLSALSRIIIATFNKRLGPINILFVAHLITGVIMLTMWLPGKTFSIYLAFYIILATTSTVFFTLGPIIIASYYPNERISQANGMSYLASGFSTIISVPTAGVVFDKVGKRTNYHPLIIMGGIFYLITLVPLFFLRRLLNKKN
ncbi:hypothetical protein BB558_000814 [Smittium angustum]|uniref:Major facilitator superfamily (MFS) profile domain-containing protein n=1 Tax=Smittium angustum TaxID=133377 RepID=A0A2U1JD44_SMIAN|nr:hypothetical protein BB558_000814 [Smittium angustum]